MDSPGKDEDQDAIPTTSVENENPSISPTNCEVPADVEGRDPENEMDWMERIFGLEETNPLACGDADLDTQVLNFDEETQMVDDGVDYFHIEEETTQLVDDEYSVSADETFDGTENLCEANCDDDDRLYDGESAKKSPVFSCDGRCESGTVSQLTSVKEASGRASSVATLEVASLQDGSLCLLSKSSVELEERGGSEIDGKEAQVVDITDQELGTVEYDDELEKKESECKYTLDSSTVQTIFTQVLIDRSLCFPRDSNSAASAEDPQNSDERMTDLTYIYSQEPGEASQANAFDCVRRIIDDTKDLLGVEADLLKSGKETSLCNSTGKCLQSLAKKVGDKGNSGSGGTFDWDDRYEDEEGGEFYCRNKEEFFGSTRKAPAGSGASGRKRRQSKLIVEKTLDLGHFEFAVNDKTIPEMDNSRIANIVGGLDEQITSNQVAQQLDRNSSGKVEDNLAVGVNTQMAIEAIESLSKGDGFCNRNNASGHPSLVINSDGLTDRLVEHNLTSVVGGLKSIPSGTNVSVHSSKKDADKLTLSQSLTAVKRKTGRSTSLGVEATASRTNRSGKRMSYPGQKSTIKSKKTKYNLECEIGTEGAYNQDLLLADERIVESGVSECTPYLRDKRDRVCSGSEANVSSVTRRTRLSKAETETSLPSVLMHKPSSRQTRSGSLKSALDGIDGKEALHHSKRSLNPVAVTTRKTRSELSCLTLPSMPSDTKQRTIVSDVKKFQETAVSISSGSNCTSQSNKTFLQNNNSTVGILPDLNVCISESVKRYHSKKGEPRAMNADIQADCASPRKIGSPVYLRSESSRVKSKSASTLMLEIHGLRTREKREIKSPNVSRKRKDWSNVKVLFSQHLDNEVLKQQRKIVERLNISVASSISDATHFVADQFLRTRNMLEAIASGKPIVTHLWLEDVGQANYYIDEQKYILQDGKKEKELGFNMSLSLARARQNHLLQGRKVLITSNVKPSAEIISSLVKAVHGQVVKRVCRSLWKDNSKLDDLLILSCEEDYESCVEFLERGADVYSSELLLDGIVTQKLEYERHRLFTENLKRTRGTVWFKRDGSIFVPVKRR